ncbi:hypothetical protein TH24_21310 [Thalassospira xiamenensis]|nr:hypothetical protein TH24_21310 [Thalassospira xiamenensis]
MRSIWFFPISIFKLAWMIYKFKPSIVQSWMHYADLVATLALLISGRRKNTRLIWGVRCSNLDFSQYGWKLFFTVKVCSFLSAKADVIIANSEAGRSAHVKLGYASERFRVVHNGIDVDKFAPIGVEARNKFRAKFSIPEDAFIVVMAARFDPQKDYQTFLRVVGRLPECVFLVAGTDTEKLPRISNVIKVGVFGDMPTLFGSADCVLSTSAYGEGFPNVVAEAMACGVPAVATNVGDVSLIIGDTGYITDVKDCDGIVNAIISIKSECLHDKERRSKMSRRRILENFELKKMISQLIYIQS